MLIEEEEEEIVTEQLDLADDSDYAASQRQGLGDGVRLDSVERSGFDKSSEFEIVYSKVNVAIHPSQLASERIDDRLRLIKQEPDVFLPWMPFKPSYGRVRSFGHNSNSSTLAKGRDLYTVKDVLLSDIHSVRRHTPTLGLQYIIIALSSGLAYPPLDFHSGGVRECFAALKQHVLIVRSSDDANVFLVNNFQDPLREACHLWHYQGLFPSQKRQLCKI
ncbi:uncharacterized protein A4U43_C05F32790 [Asparagus officinalis]|uniref:Small G protein signalling modulator 1/2 Rab-binding domain-containing protein n=1 Tax=Asparagus officinalis TaxID=4686 RepID=A0A5P1EYT4_ASPOF|nr:uncharacterized protein A4U43_C05F32790 [Asparagus officinalis]